MPPSCGVCVAGVLFAYLLELKASCEKVSPVPRGLVIMMMIILLFYLIILSY